MSADINAFGILLAAISTAVLLLVYARKPKKLRKILNGLYTGIAVSIVSLIFSFHGCSNGEPLTQWLIPGICIFMLITFIDHKVVLALSVAFMTVASLFLSMQYASLVHTEDYIGVPNLQHRIYENGGYRTVTIETYRIWHTVYSGIYGIKKN